MWLKVHVDSLFTCHVVGWKKKLFPYKVYLEITQAYFKIYGDNL